MVRRLLVLALVFAALLPGRARASPDEHPAVGEDDTLYSCKNRTGMVAVTFKPETDLKDLVTWVMGFTCKNFSLGQYVTSTKKVTLIVPNKMTATEAYRVFLGALATMGYTIVPKGSVLNIVETATAKRSTVPIFKQGLPDDTEQIVRYVFKPTYAQPEALQKALGTLKSDAGEIEVIGAMLLITDYGSHIRDIMSLARLIDVPGGTDGIYTIPVHHADAAKLAEKINAILGLGTAGSPATPPAKPAEPTTALPSKILVDERTNTLIVSASDAGYQRVQALVDRLDIALDIEGGTSIHVYQLGSAIAEELAKTLNSAIETQQNKAAAKPAGAPAQPASADGLALEGQARVIADIPTNKVIVMSSGRDFIAIKDVIKELDQPRRQVYIEAMILEIQLSNDLEVGTSSHGGLPVDSGSSLVVGGVQTPNLKSLNLSTLTAASGLIGGLIGGPLANSQTILGTSIPSYGILFQALLDKSSTNIVSAPSIICVDNVQATYKVGTDIPFKRGISYGGITGGSTPTGSATVSIDREPLVLELDIKPHISSGDSVLLEIKHEYKDLAGTDAELGPTWTTRSFETRVLASDQETVVIGGFMQEREITTTTKVPVLGDIPLLGYLFKYEGKIKKRSNLLIMLTPYIIKDQLDLEAIRQRKAREHDEFISSYRSLDHAKYEPKIDYRRKRGVIEEINRSLQSVDEDAAARAALHAPATVETGSITPRPAVLTAP